ncbi:MAG: hypothetical protein OHK0029_30750 [Armatimonadaceae bacterium]
MSSWEQGRDAAPLTRVQIYKYVTKDRVLDISDMLSLEPRRSKIAFTLLQFDENYKATTRVRHYADVPDFKLVCYDMLHHQFTEWTDHKGSPTENGLQARVMTLRMDPKYRQPYVVKIDNGVGEQMSGGAVKMVEATESLAVLMPEWEARKMAQTVLDYIRDWETIHFKKRQEAQTVIFATSEGSGETTAPATVPAQPELTTAKRSKSKAG